MSTTCDDDLKQPLLDSEAALLRTQLDQSKPPLKENRAWIKYTILATILFTICNISFSECGSMGIQGLLYLSPGSLICGIVFFGWKMVEEYKRNGVCWTYLNFMEEDTNQVKWGCVGGFLVFCAIYATYQALVVVCFGLCMEAGINAGVVSTIWSISPLFSAVADFLVFNQRLTTKHMMGVLSLVLCAAAISLINVIYPPNTASDTTVVASEPTIQAWVPVLLAAICPVFFAASGL